MDKARLSVIEEQFSVCLVADKVSAPYDTHDGANARELGRTSGASPTVGTRTSPPQMPLCTGMCTTGEKRREQCGQPVDAAVDYSPILAAISPLTGIFVFHTMFVETGLHRRLRVSS